jgi:circadian clock protein KaiB
MSEGEPDEGRSGGYLLRLYITGNTQRSLQAIEAIRGVCEEHLLGRYQLEVIDIRQQPELAAREQLIAAPTLVKQAPPPVRRLVGDMRRRDRLLHGLNLPDDHGCGD